MYKLTNIFYYCDYVTITHSTPLYLFFIVHEVLTVSALDGLPFFPLVDHVSSELSAMTRPSWVALQGMTQSFIELHTPLHHDKAVIHEAALKSLQVVTAAMKSEDNCFLAGKL